MKLAVLGVGLMGRAIAERLKACGHDVIVFNRTPEKAQALAPLGIAVAATGAEAVAGAEQVLLVLSDAAAIEAVVCAPAVKALLAGKLVIQMGTIAPEESQRVAQVVEAAGGHYAEAPVLGSLAEAKSGRLLVMVGGTEARLAHLRPWLTALDPDPLHVGPVGQAAALKLALNQLIAAHITALSLSLGYLQRVGVPPAAFRRILERSTLAPAMFEKKYPRLAARDYRTPNFSVRMLLKDVRLFLREAERTGVDPRSLSGVPGLLERAIAAGHGDEDYAAVYEAVNPTP